MRLAVQKPWIRVWDGVWLDTGIDARIARLGVLRDGIACRVARFDVVE